MRFIPDTAYNDLVSSLASQIARPDDMFTGYVTDRIIEVLAQHDIMPLSIAAEVIRAEVEHHEKPRAQMPSA